MPKKSAPKVKKVSKPRTAALSIPEVNGRNLSLIPTLLKSQQVLHMLQKTPREHVFKRPGKGGGTWDFVTGAFVKKTLNYTFGWLWNFEIVDKGREGEQVWVQGRLTVLNPKTLAPMIVKEQFGRADMKFKKGTKEPLDYGNDLKAAATDALKKCASEFGIASDIYAGNQIKEIKTQDKSFTPPPETESAINGEVVGPDKPIKISLPNQLECHNCAEIIDEQVAKYSEKVFKAQLCRGCQNERKNA